MKWEDLSYSELEARLKKEMARIKTAISKRDRAIAKSVSREMLKELTRRYEESWGLGDRDLPPPQWPPTLS
jgi:DNA-binding FadR family transcriptional regulator